METSISKRIFEVVPATRTKVPLFIGMVGAPGSGKTYSALRVATGALRVTGGKLGVIDTEAGRAKHYAPKAREKADPSKGTFDFEYVNFEPPYASQDYHAAIMHLKERGCKVVVVDSMTHEHTGIGGVLDQYEAAVKDLMDRWKTTEGKVGQSAWKVAKSGRKQLLRALVQMDMIVIFCFRGKEGVDFNKKGSDMDLGWEPEGGKEIFYEMMLTCLLPPRSKGVPIWQSSKAGEDFAIKLPGQFEAIFKDRRSLDENHGEALARWAEGGEAVKPEPKPEAPAPVSTTVAEPEPEIPFGEEAPKRMPYNILEELSKLHNASVSKASFNAAWELLVARKSSIKSEDWSRLVETKKEIVAHIVKEGIE